MRENVQPETIFIGGCSAAPWCDRLGTHVMRDFPESNWCSYDCGAGIITDSFLRDSFPVVGA